MVACFYSTALCNLSCSYCYINKGENLKGYDDALEKSFKDPDYYLSLFKRIVPENKQSVERIEVWGGEPLLHLDRVEPTIKLFVDEYKALNQIFFSSNFCHERVVPSILSLSKLLGGIPGRDFTIKIQISLDGPPDISDKSRGVGVTSRILKNLSLLIASLENLPSNVKLRLNLKPTLDIGCIQKFLSKDYCVEYYKYFEDNIVDPVVGLNSSKISIAPASLSNLVVPYPYTKDDGVLFADVCKNLFEISVENKASTIFKYYKVILPYLKHGLTQRIDTTKYNFNGGFCGAALGSVTLLPDNKVAICHRSIGDIADNLVTPVNDKVSNGLFVLNGVGDYEKACARFNNLRRNGTSLIVDLTTLIRTLASVNQVDAKYLDEQLAMEGAYFIASQASLCVHSNYDMTGSQYLMYTGYVKLFLNGASEYILAGKELL